LDIVKEMWGIHGGVTADGDVMFLREKLVSERV